MNSVTTNGASLGRCSRTRHAAFPGVDDRRILNGIFWVLRSGAPWRDLPDSYGPPTTCYNRFVRWRRAGVWDQIMEALAAAHDAAVQMIDTSIVRVHQHGACIANNSGQLIGRSRGGLTNKIHVVVDGNGLPVQLGLTGGQTHDNRLCSVLLRHPRRARLLADRGYDADWIRAFVNERGAWANIPPKRIAKTQSASAPFFTATATWSSGSSTRSSSAGASRHDMTSSPLTISRSSSSPASAYGCAFMSPRPRLRRRRYRLKPLCHNNVLVNI
jgi:transposase